MQKDNFERYHLGYDEKSEQGYLNILKLNTEKLVLDRSFISELVYGPVLRNSCKINKQQIQNIINQYVNAKTRIVYLKSSKETLLERRKFDLEDTEMLQKYFEILNERYNKVMNFLRRYFPVLEIDTSINNQEEVYELVSKFVEAPER